MLCKIFDMRSFQSILANHLTMRMTPYESKISWNVKILIGREKKGRKKKRVQNILSKKGKETKRYGKIRKSDKFAFL